MNVFVRELGGALARAGVGVRCYTRRTDPAAPRELRAEPGFDIVHLDVGDPALAKEDLPDLVTEFADALEQDLSAHPEIDVLHANYWLSAAAGHLVKHRLDLPLITTFHTLGAVKHLHGDAEPDDRLAAERQVVGCSDVVTAATPSEALQLVELYDAAPERIELVAPGVDRAFFSPGDQAAARRAIGVAGGPVVLFVGRIQPLKGLDVAVAALADLPTATRLVVVGGASGPDGLAELERVSALAAELDVADRIHWFEPQPHHLLSSFYRAADVVVVPSRSESFGLVALEAAACGVPVVATDTGGLSHVVVDGATGLLVPDRRPRHVAEAIERLLSNPEKARSMGRAAARRAESFTWSTAAARLRRVYADVSTRQLVACR